MLFVIPVPRTRLLSAMDRLHRCSLIERGQKRGSFTLQSVVQEYLTERLITDSFDELRQGRFARLIEHRLVLASAKDYLRQTQERLLVAPLLTLLAQGQIDLASQIRTRLDDLRNLPAHAQGYAPANLITLLRLHQGHLRALDLSGLALRSIYLQGVEMQDTTLSNALMQDNVYAQPFSAVLAVDVSKAGDIGQRPPVTAT